MRGKTLELASLEGGVRFTIQEQGTGAGMGPISQNQAKMNPRATFGPLIL